VGLFDPVDFLVMGLGCALGCMSPEQAEGRLVDAVRQRRQRRNLPQGGFARVIRSSQSLVAKIEAGDRRISLRLLVRSLLALGTSDEELAAALASTNPAT
jgi:transcriptional regulator with XRE-family HTH domain